MKNKIIIAIVLAVVLSLTGFILLKPNEEHEALQLLKHNKKDEGKVKHLLYLRRNPYY